MQYMAEEIEEKDDKIEEMERAHDVRKKGLDIANDTIQRRDSEYHVSLENYQNQDYQNREELAKQKLRIKELEEQNGLRRFRWLERESPEAQLRKCREENQSLKAQMTREIEYRDNAIERADKLENEANTVNVALKEAKKYITKMKKRFKISPRTSREIEQMEDASGSQVAVLAQLSSFKADCDAKLYAQTLTINNLRASPKQRKHTLISFRKQTPPHSPSLQPKMAQRVRKKSTKTASQWLDVSAKFEMFHELKRASDQQLEEKDDTIAQLQADVDSVDKEIKDMKSQIQTFQAMESEHSRCKEDLDAQIDQNTAHENNVQQMKATADELSREINAQKERQEEQKTKISGLEKHVQKLKTSSEGAEIEKLDLEKDIQELRTSLDGSETKLKEAKDNASTEQQKAQSDYDKAQKELGSAQQDLKDLQEVHAKCLLSSTNDAMDVEVNSPSTEKEPASTEKMDVDSFQSTVDEHAITIQVLKDELKQMTESRDKWKCAVEESRSDSQDHEMTDAYESSKEIEARLNDRIGGQFHQLVRSLQDENAKIKTKNAELQTIRADARAEAASLRQTPSKAQQEIARLKKEKLGLDQELRDLKADTTVQQEMARLRKEKQESIKELKNLKDDSRANAIKRTQDGAERAKLDKARETRLQDEMTEQVRARKTAEATLERLQKEIEGLKKGNEGQTRGKKRDSSDDKDEQDGDSMEGKGQKRFKPGPTGTSTTPATQGDSSSSTAMPQGNGDNLVQGHNNAPSDVGMEQGQGGSESMTGGVVDPAVDESPKYLQRLREARAGKTSE